LKSLQLEDNAESSTQQGEERITNNHEHATNGDPNNHDSHHNDTNNNYNNNNNVDSKEPPEEEEPIETGASDPPPHPEGGAEAQVAVPEPSNFNVKHPLQNAWTIWFDNPGKRTNVASWGDFLKKVTTVATVEDFWSVFNYLKPASTLPQGANYHIFKEHIEPKWEDAQNAKGGKWTVSVPPKNRATALDQMWLYTVLACIGETIRAPDDVCGLVVSIRKAGDRVQIWTRDASNTNACLDIGRSLKEILEIPENVPIGYMSHADSMKKSPARNKYEV